MKGPVNHNLYNNSDTAYAASFLVQVVPAIAWMAKVLSYWTFTDAAFTETGQLDTPFHNGYGILSVDGIAKPAYRAFQILRNLPTRLAPLKAVKAQAAAATTIAPSLVTPSPSEASGTWDGVDGGGGDENEEEEEEAAEEEEGGGDAYSIGGWMGLDAENKSLSIVLTRFLPLATNPAKYPAPQEQTRIHGARGAHGRESSKGNGAGAGAVQLAVTIPAVYLQAAATRKQRPWIEVIDDKCCTNPRTEWEKMGSPKSLSTDQRNRLVNASALRRSQVTVHQDTPGSDGVVTISMSPYTVVHLHV